MMVIQIFDNHTMTELNDAFENAQKDIKKLNKRPDDASLLKLYALYKQGSTGDVQGDKPGFFDFVGAAKYEAWEKLQGTSSDEAKQMYVDLVAKLSNRD
jgi:acyl-CoA-binding protein